jgi:serine/threonine-protein kinase
MMLQFVPGGNLSALLGESEKMPFETVAHLAKQICEALLYLDEKGVSYPILKPEHVMFLDEQHSEVCLIDLSHTFFAHDDQNASVGGAIFLNPNYSAPEVLMGRPPTILSSAYSVACLIHRCLTGENLFGAQTDLQLATKHMSEKLPAFDWSKYGVPSDFEQILVAALSKSPSDRATVPELAAITAKYTD